MENQRGMEPPPPLHHSSSSPTASPRAGETPQFCSPTCPLSPFPSVKRQLHPFVYDLATYTQWTQFPYNMIDLPAPSLSTAQPVAHCSPSAGAGIYWAGDWAKKKIFPSSPPPKHPPPMQGQNTPMQCTLHASLAPSPSPNFIHSISTQSMQARPPHAPFPIQSFVPPTVFASSRASLPLFGHFSLASPSFGD